MADVFEEGKDLIVNLGDDGFKKQGSKQGEYTTYEDVDLASGYPADQIWTTRDGRRIAIPNMTDSHLLNTIAYLRRRVEDYRKMVIAEIAKGIVENLTITRMFDMPKYEEREFEAANAEAYEYGKKVFRMSEEEILLNFTSRYRQLYQEAYKRKILIEVDNGKIQ